MNPVETIATKVQALPTERRWLYAQEEVIYAIARGRAPVRGPWMSWADRIADWGMRLGIERAVLALASVWLLTISFLRQYRVPVSSRPRDPVFIGLGALREPALIAEFERRFACRAEPINQFEMADFWRLQRLTLRQLLCEWRTVWREIRGHLWHSEIEGFDRRYCISGALARLHHLVYFRAWIREYCRTSGTFLVGVAHASLAAYAAAAADARTVYLPHGFQRRSLALPDLDEILCFTRYEAEHWRERLSGAKVGLLPTTGPLIESDRAAAVVGDYLEEVDFDLCRSFIQWARDRGVPVVVRPHPKDCSGYWQRWQGVEGVEIRDELSGFNEFLDKVRPRFIATWLSTTMFDALVRGVLPISFARDAMLLDLIVPVEAVALRWPEAETDISRLLEEPELCRQLAQRKAGDVTSDPWRRPRLAAAG